MKHEIEQHEGKNNIEYKVFFPRKYENAHLK